MLVITFKANYSPCLAYISLHSSTSCDCLLINKQWSMDQSPDFAHLGNC